MVKTLKEIRHKLHYGGLIDMPSLALVLLAPALWLTWPRHDKKPEHPRRVSQTRVVFIGSADARIGGMYRQPLHLIRDGLGADQLPDEAFAEAFRMAWPPRTEVLASSQNSRIATWSAAADVRLPDTDRDTLEYRPVWRECPVFLRGEDQPSEWIVELSGALKKMDFSVPDTAPLKAYLKDIREARVWLDFDADGYVRNVILDKSSGNPDLDTAVLRWLYRTEPSDRYRNRSGRLTVSCGPL